MLQNKRSIHKNQLQFYTLAAKKFKDEMKKAIPFRIATHTHTQISLKNFFKVQDTYTENYKT